MKRTVARNGSHGALELLRTHKALGIARPRMPLKTCKPPWLQCKNAAYAYESLCGIARVAMRKSVVPPQNPR